MISQIIMAAGAVSVAFGVGVIIAKHPARPQPISVSLYKPGIPVLVDSSGWFHFLTEDGLRVWQGKNSVYNPAHEFPRWLLFPFILTIIIMLGWLLILLIIFSKTQRRSMAAGLRRWPLSALIVGVKQNQFEGDLWRLVLRDDRLEYVAAFPDDRGRMVDLGPTEWAAPLPEVATVETSRTHDWHTVRRWHETQSPQAIPDKEYQTYVMTSDGRRLVIHTANADREGTAALALSVRGAVEVARSASLRSSVVPAAPTTAAPDPGFSL